MHEIEKKRNASEIDLNKMQKNENEMNKGLKYMDSIVTTMNPEINASIPEQHSCQKSSNEIQDNTQQLHRIN